MLLEASHVSLHVGPAVLVDDVSLALEEGRLTVIVGPNGAGKTSLLRLLVGETAPTRGAVLVGNRPIGSIAPWELACLRTVMTQNAFLAFPFTVHELLSIAMDGVGYRLLPRQREALMAEALTSADVAHLAGRVYATLSGGEQQRVQFARALCQLGAGATYAGRQILFLDEPTASLDLSHALALLDAARRQARQGRAVCAIVHDLNLAVAFADEIVVIERGRIAATGSPADVLDTDLLQGVFKTDLTVHAVAGRLPAVVPQWM